MARPCSVGGCDKDAHARGLCPAHYQRKRVAGDVQADTPLRPTYGKVNCSVDGCSQPRRKRSWCASHYAQWQRTGNVKPFRYKWSSCGTCAVCGKATGAVAELRKYCGWACASLAGKHRGAVPMTFICAHCERELPLHGAGKNGRRLKSDTKLCARCRQDLRKHGMSVETLVKRDGSACGICKTNVDMTLRWPHPNCASVDHIVPRARGGTNDPANLQLAHMRCNSGKRDRLEVSA